MIIGDRKRIPHHLAHENFWLLIELNVVPMAVWDAEGGLIAMNLAALDLFGYLKEDFDSGKMNWRALTPEEYHPLDEKCLHELEESHTALPYDKEYIRKDGSRIKVRLHNASADQGKTGVVIFVSLN